MARFTYPYEITKLYAIKEKEPDKVDTEISYAFAIQENFDIIRKYLNEIIGADNIVQNSLTGGSTGSLGLTTITNVNIANNTITGTQLATDTITLANLGTTWTDWAPEYSATGNMTYTSVTTIMAKYFVIDKVCFFNLCAMGTTGGTADIGIRFTIPIHMSSPDYDNRTGGGCNIRDGDDRGGVWHGDGVNYTIRVHKYNNSNWGLGTGRKIIVQGFYRID